MRPQLCDIFEYDGRTYRATGFMKKVVVTLKPGADVHARITYDILKRMNGDKETVTKTVWCTADDAEVVCGAGIGGCIAPLDKIVITGRVKWTPEQIAEEEKMYNGFYVGEQFFG